MAEQKCPNCHGHRGFELVPLEGCPGIRAVQCKLCGAPIAVLTDFNEKLTQLIERLDTITQRSEMISEI